MHDKQMVNCDILIDDGPHNLENGNYHKVLLTAPHNKKYDAAANGIFRAEDWNEIYMYIKTLDILYTEEGKQAK